jgi:hypothetical protein
MINIPPPPVPQPLREMLKDYPELIEELQQDLSSLVAEMIGKRPNATPPFERAVWLLQDVMGAFYSDAREEFSAAEQSGDPVLIEKAETKRHLVGSARLRRVWSDNDELSDYFKTYGRVFE